MTENYYKPGPCQPYDYISFCALPTGSESVSGYALEAASEILYQATAQRFDNCEVTLRPCRRDCNDSWLLAGAWWDGVTYPYPVKLGGTWFNVTCGTCADYCACTMISEIVLPGPVRDIVSVIVDGVTLTKNVDYRLDDYRKLIRLGGETWPYCNELNAANGQPGTWTVTATYGEPLPMLGKLAMGELFCNILRDLMGDTCALPPGVTSITRQGVSMDLEAIDESLKNGFQGLKYVDTFIQRYNPHRLDARSAIYDIDGSDYGRVLGTVIT